MLQVLYNIVNPAYELLDIGITGILQAPEDVYFLVFELPQKEEVGDYILDEYRLVGASLRYMVPSILFKNSKGFYHHVVTVRSVLIGLY